ncbi:type VI secretion system Vgr family protein, partial [Chromobacterium piscinae]
PLTPAYAGTELAKPTSLGVQTATVVGPAGEEVHTDQHGRIKVQFHWQRPDEHPTIGAALDDKSSCWLRVAMPSAGAGWGHQFIPRKTQLNQGYLAHPRSNGKAQPRGDGFELRTDHHGAIRAAHGLLLTTEAQNGASGKQLAREHAQSQLDAALSLSQALAETATGQLADTMETGPDEIGPDNAKAGKKTDGHLQHHADALKAWEVGSNTDKDGKTAKEQAGRQPLLVLSGPAGIASLTEQSQTISAGQNLNLVAQRDANH